MAEPSNVSESIYAPLRIEAGLWDADVAFYEDDQVSGHAKGAQTNSLLANGHWMVNDFVVTLGSKRPPYHGHGIWGFDPVAKTYVNTRVDTNDRAVRTDYGFWREAEKTMVWAFKLNDGAGHFTDYRMS